MFFDSWFCYDTQVKTNEQMKKHCLLNVGGNAKYFAKVNSLNSLRLIIDGAKQNNIPYKVIGNGSNILFSDKGFNGLIISLENLNDIYFSNGKVRAMAGARLQKLIDFTIKNNLNGLEPLLGIPAQIGGAVYMNASCFNCNISDYIDCVETLGNHGLKKYNKQDCKFSYRKSIFRKINEPITSVYFSFNSGCRKDQLKKYTKLRQEKQPFGKNCGSIFKNPKGDFAGRIIDGCGLKGLSINNVSISNKNANFLEFNGYASSQDIYNLIKKVKTIVFEKTGINLKEEIEYIGEFK